MNLPTLEKQLIERVREEQRRWQDIARLLMQVRSASLWQGHAASFTAWVDGLARRADLQASVFWRCLNAGRIYVELTGDDALEAEAGVSAEALELADKIRRHAPRAVAHDVLERTLDGGLSRAELRKVWDTYRVAAGGATARGRLPDDPDARAQALSERQSSWDAHKRKPETRADLKRSELVGAFREASFLGAADQARSEVKLSAISGRLSALLVVRRKAAELDRVELHGLWTAVALPELQDFEYKPPSGLDYVWLAVPAELTAEARERAPRLLGLLELRREPVLHVTRPAQRRPIHAEGRLSLLSTLLQTAYLWPQ